MPTHTKYANLTNDEFLSKIDGIKHHSPIILELVSRLEKELNGLGVSKDVNHCAECPICEGSLTVEYDDANRLFELKPSD